MDIAQIAQLMVTMAEHGAIRVKVGDVEIVLDPRRPEKQVPLMSAEEKLRVEMALSAKTYPSNYEDPDLWDGQDPPQIPSPVTPDSETGAMS